MSAGSTSASSIGIQAIPILDCFFLDVTPFGLYCNICQTPVGNNVSFDANVIQKHSHRNHHKNVTGKSFADIALLSKNIYNRNFGVVNDVESWICSDVIDTHSCSCGKGFRKEGNLTRHIKQMVSGSTTKDNSNGPKHTADKAIKSRLSKCGRMIDISMIFTMKQKASEHTVSTMSSLSRTNSSLSSHIQQQSMYLPISVGNNKWVTTTIENVRDKFKVFKRPDEDLSPYLNAFKLMLIHSGEDVINSHIKKCYKYMSDPIDSTSEYDNGLAFFIGIYVGWTKTYSREHVNCLDGRIRHRLQSFFDKSEFSLLQNNSCFTMRLNEDVIIEEIQLIVKLSWRMIMHGITKNTNLATQLRSIIQQIKSIATKYNNNPSNTAIQEIIQKLLIQRYLHLMFIESRTNAFSILFGLNLVMIRLFKKTKNTQSTSDNNIEIRSCGEFGSIISTHIHIYRLASSSLLACTNSMSWEMILTQIDQSTLCHLLSPLINRVSNMFMVILLCIYYIPILTLIFNYIFITQVKQMQRIKIDIRKKQLKPNGDIIIDNFYFPKNKWSMLIPKIVRMFDSVLEDVLIGTSWKNIVNMKLPINVNRLESESNDVSKDMIMHYQFNTNNNGRITNESVIRLKEAVSQVKFDKLTGLVMICLHGLGKILQSLERIYIYIYIHHIFLLTTCHFLK